MKPRRVLGLWALALLLAGCAGMPERLSLGQPREQIEAALGRPTAVHPLPDGTRLQYSRQPAGQQVYNLDLDAQGRLRQTQQVMEATLLQRVAPDQWTREQVQVYLGRPAMLERVARFEGQVWTYRFDEATRPRLFHVFIDPAGVVRRTQFSDELPAIQLTDGVP